MSETNGVELTDRTVLDRARSEYQEMPGLQLTPSQVQRLLGATPQETAMVIEHLLGERFLRRTGNGLFIRA